MKKTLFLHIGMGKTGTTALQKFFWENRRRLKKSGVSYPEFATVSHAHHLVSPHIPDFLDGVWDFMPVQQWAPKVAKIRARKILLSSELIGWTEENAVENFCSEVEKWFDLVVVIYLRRQDNIMMASYNQQVKAGQQKRNLESILKRQMARFDYSKILAPWDAALGKDKIIVRAYEQQQFYKGDIRRDFMHHVLGVPVDRRYTFGEENLNPSLSAAVSAYKLVINNIVEDKEVNDQFNVLLAECSRDLGETAKGIFSDHAILSPAVRLEIIQASEPVNSAIARRYLGRKDGRLFYDPLPARDQDWSGGHWTVDDLEEISLQLVRKDRKLMQWLVGEAAELLEVKNSQRRLAAHIITRSVADLVDD